MRTLCDITQLLLANQFLVIVVSDLYIFRSLEIVSQLMCEILL